MKLESLTKITLLSLTTALVLFAATTAKGVPYASGITNGGGTVSFVLNEIADNVQVKFNNATITTNLGGKPAGRHSVPLGGATNFQIVVTRNAPAGWTQISSDQNTYNQFYSARGLAVNSNPTNSALFGRVYVSNPIGGTTAVTGARNLGKGIYILNADLSDALGRGNTASTGGVLFDSTSGSPVGGDSPWRIEVGPDNNLYIADYSTNKGTVYLTDPDVNTNTVVLQGIGKNANTTVHTTIGSLVVRGSLETGNLTIWANDGHMSPINYIRRWDIGAGPLPYNSAPVSPTSGSPGYLGVAHLQLDLDMSADGTKLYESINRSAGTDTDSIRIYDNDTFVWGSKTAGGSPDLMRQARALRVSPDGRNLFVIQDTNTVLVLPLDTSGLPPTTIDVNSLTTLPVFPSSPTVGRELTFDAAGNLYVVSSGREALRVFSPGGSTVATTTGDLSGGNGNFSVTTDTFSDPYVAFQPQDQVIVLTNSVTFRSLAGGTGPFAYQWQKDGVDIGGATDTSYTIASVQETDAGSYTVVVTGALGSETSREAILTVATAPVLFTQPQSLTVSYSSNAVFTVGVVGSLPLSYQWYTNGVAVSGGTANTYTKSNAQTNETGLQVYAVAANSYGSVTSSVATLTVGWSAPTFTVQPADTNVLAGTNATFTAAATGMPAPSYQWRFNWNNINGQTGTTLIRTNVQTTTLQGFYTVVASNAFGMATSAVATLTVTDSAPIITRQPIGTSTNAGASVAFSVVTLGSDARSFQWILNGTNIMGATASSYTRSNAQQDTSGNYQVLVSNYFGSVLSDPAYLSVADAAPSIVSSSVSRTVAAGTNVVFTATTRGTDPRTYQWTFNSSPISYATNSAFTLTNAQPANSGDYVLTIGNTYGTISTTNIQLTVTNTPARIITQPANRTVGAGQDSIFTVTTFGNDIRSYQWYRNGTTISGATSNSFTFVNPQTSDSGSYFYVIVQNSLGTAQSTNAVLTVTNRVPTIVIQPTNQVTTVGGSATFTVTAQGEAPLSYQWRLGTNDIVGATSSSYTVNNAQLANAATNYNVVVSNSAGSTTSQAAQLAVTTTTTPGTGTGVLAEYFASQYLTASLNSNVSFTIPPTVTKVETNLDFNFSTGSPDPSVPPDYFLARWTGQLQPLYSQVYTFYTKSDDGVRVWINNQLIIDKWQSGGNQNYSYVMSNAFVAGQKYDVRMEFLEITSGAEAHLFWSSDSQIKEPIAMSQLYTNSGAYLIGIEPLSRVMQVDESEPSAFTAYAGGTGPLTYQWRFNGVNISGATSSVLPRYAAQLNDAGTYSVVVSGPFGSTTNGYPVTLTVPTELTPGTGTGLIGDYFSGKNSSSLYYTNPPTLSRIDTNVDFTWGTGSPDVSISVDTFISRWTGKVQPQLSEVYTFQVFSDDGARLWVDNQLIIDQWLNGNTNTTRVGTMPYAFVAGQNYDIRLEVFENTGSAEAHLRWSAPHLASEVIPTSQLSPSSGAYIIAQTPSQAVLAGTDAVFTVYAGGSGTLTYQWKKNGSNISGATTSALTIVNAQTTDVASYNVAITGTYGSTATTNAVLSILPTFLTQPQSQTVLVGTNVNFSVSVVGSGQLSYQWQKDGAAISGAITNTLALSNVQTNDSGSYTVVVTNAFGSTTSSAAVLTVNSASAPPPTIGSISVSGGNINFSFTTTSGFTYHVQFKADLNAPSWTPVEDIPGTGGIINRSYAIGAGNGFYRIVVD